MRILGFTIPVLLIIFIAFVLGTKFPNTLSGIPVVGK